jgi:hypothetical protein
MVGKMRAAYMLLKETPTKFAPPAHPEGMKQESTSDLIGDIQRPLCTM